MHVDGAFGLWAAGGARRGRTSPAGVADADSWATDAHKWLNVPVRQRARVRARRGSAARRDVGRGAYLPHGAAREPGDYTPEASRRARGVEVWAALRSLGRAGVADLIERTCRHATRFAEGLRAAGAEVLNDVVLNQVVVSFGDDGGESRGARARRRADGTCWCGPTVWRGRAAMRISVSSWATTADDVERSLAAIVRAARLLDRSA